MTPHIQNIPEQKYEITPLELLFGLVFAFGVSQLSLHLVTHLSCRGAAETLLMLLAVFAAIAPQRSRLYIPTGSSTTPSTRRLRKHST